MNKIKLLFYMCCILKTLVTGKETPDCFSKISLNNQNKKDNNNKKNLFRALGCGTFTGLSLVSLQYKFPVFFQRYSRRLPSMMTANYKRLFLTGFVTGASFYVATFRILKKLKTDHKNKNDDHSNPEIPSSEPKSPLEKIDEKPTMKTAKICLVTPGYFQGYIESIKTIFDSSFFGACSAGVSLDFKEVGKVQLWLISRQNKFRNLTPIYIEGTQLAARVFVMPDTQEIREEFERLVKEGCDGDALDQYCDKKNEEHENTSDMLDCCYILRINKEECGKIDSEQFQNSQINSCCFKLNKKIDKNDHKITIAEFISFMKQETP